MDFIPVEIEVKYCLRNGEKGVETMEIYRSLIELCPFKWPRYGTFLSIRVDNTSPAT